MKARDNPFAVDRLEALCYRFTNDSWEDLLQRLERARYRGAIVGPEGAGKTTLMLELRERLRRQGKDAVYLRLRADERHRAPQQIAQALGQTPGERTLLLLDGSESLSFIAWHQVQRLCRSQLGLVITSHRPGRLPTLMTCQTRPRLLAELIRELLPREPELDPQTIDALYRRQNGNLRNALRELYDRYAVKSPESLRGMVAVRIRQLDVQAPSGTWRVIPETSSRIQGGT